MKQVIPTHAVKAVITNNHGDILFLQRNGAGRADMKSNWDLPGGLVEEGESDIVALEREVKEELNREASIGQKLGIWTFFRPFDGSTVQVTNYAVELDTSDIKILSLSDEHVAAKFVSKVELPELEVKDPSIFAVLGEYA
jgi:8-oxo-dGTP diphosphatase